MIACIVWTVSACGNPDPSAAFASGIRSHLSHTGLPTENGYGLPVQFGQVGLCGSDLGHSGLLRHHPLANGPCRPPGDPAPHPDGAPLAAVTTDSCR